jgi:superfamily II DNA or RNA helicase
VTDTVETLSLPDQQLDAAFFRSAQTFRPQVVIDAPCGFGKTLGAAACIAEQWHEGILYVAERKAQLDSMQELLVKTHGVNPALIGVYHGDSKDVERLEQDGDHKPIALVTHARMMSYSPEDYVHFESRGCLRLRQLLICDEAVVP